MDFMKHILLALGSVGLFVICLIGLSIIGAIMVLVTGINFVATSIIVLVLAIAITSYVRERMR